MKKSLIVLLSFAVLCACGDMLEDDNVNSDQELDVEAPAEKPNDDLQNDDQDNEPTDEVTFNVEDLYGFWEVTHVKYEEGLSMTEWDGEEFAFIQFNEDGTYAAADIWGKGEVCGNYEVIGNTIVVSYDESPFVEYEVLFIEQKNVAEFKSVFVETGQQVWLRAQWYEADEGIVVPPQTTVPGTTIFENEDGAYKLVGSIYDYFRKYMLYQHFVEYNALTNNHIELGESSSLLYTVWKEAYADIRNCNLCIDGFASAYKYSWTASLEEHARVLRAFIYYQLIVLWGDVPYLNEDNFNDTDSINKGFPRVDASEILTAEIASINTQLADLEDVDLGTFSLTKDAVYALMAEMNLYMGNAEAAKTCLDKMDLSDDSIYSIPLYNLNLSVSELNNYKELIWGDAFDYMSIYSTSTIDLYYREIAGETDALLTEWSTQPQYGYWAALNRLGMAQKVTGCKKHEVLMPIPRREIDTNKNLKQNPGY